MYIYCPKLYKIIVYILIQQIKRFFWGFFFLILKTDTTYIYIILYAVCTKIHFYNIHTSIILRHHNSVYNNYCTILIHFSIKDD